MHHRPRLTLLSRLGTLLLVTIVSVSCRSESRSNTVTVYAAASLTDVGDSLLTRMKSRFPEMKFVINTAGSSLLARQIESGADFDIFLSANTLWMQRINDDGHLGKFDTLQYTNTLALVGSAIDVKKDVPQILLDNKRIGVGDPQHVPVGIYARESLECYGLWADAESKLIPLLDARSVLVAANNASVDAGIVYTTDAMTTRLERVSFDEYCQPVITYTVGVRNNAREEVSQIFDFLLDEEDADIWFHFGFLQRR